MKKDISIVAAIMITGALVLASGCNSMESRYTVMSTTLDVEASISAEVESEMSMTEDLSHEAGSTRNLTKRFGTYEMAEGWIEVDEHSEAPFYFTYVYQGTEQQELPNNITVYANIGNWSLSESDQLKKEIIDGLNEQAAQKNIDVQITDSTVITPDGTTVFCFELIRDSNRTVQYYIPGEKQFLVVSLGIYDEQKAKDDRSEEVALAIVNTFAWSESGVKI